MRIESSVTSLSWIPSEAIKGMVKMPFEVGMTHYDDPPPDVLGDIEELRLSSRFRFANELRAWIEVEDGKVTGAGYAGGGHLGITALSFGVGAMRLQAIAFPDLQQEPEVGADAVRFVQTVGGRANLPAPRPVRHKPFIQLRSPSVWTTLALTIGADGSSSYEVVGASRFPRHWIYDGSGTLDAKVGLTDFKDWSRHAFGKHSPWGDEDSPALVTTVETALERQLSTTIMRGGQKPKLRKVKEGDVLVAQGADGNEIFLLLDGVLAADVDGEPLAEFGPGAVLGERAVLEGGTRTATLRALTPCRVAVAEADQIDRDALQELSQGHRREEQREPRQHREEAAR